LIVTALVLFCCNTLSANTLPTPATSSAIELKSSAPAEPAEEAKPAKPDAPTAMTTVSSKSEPEFGSGVKISTPASEPILSTSMVKPATTESYETSRQRKIWLGLMAVSHGAATFDAWTTRRAISGGYGVEADPLQRPFAHSGAIYASTQVTPLIMDYLGHRMMRSSHPWMRRAWWAPQAASASVSLGAGIHNYGVVH
jgi:hypothetical protein